MNGRLFLYPNQNRGIVVLSADRKISNNPLSMVILNLSKVAQGTNENGTDDDVETMTSDGNQGSNIGINFGKYDGLQFRFNPAAINVQKHHRVKANLDDAQSVYGAVFGQTDTDKIHTAIARDKQRISQNVAAAGALKLRLEKEGFKVPNDPKWLADKWRPYDAVNLSTGKTANGENVSDYLPDSTTSDSVGESTEYPDTLKGAHGKHTIDGAPTDTDVNTTGPNNIAATAGNQWTRLQEIWTNLLSEKRDIYVTQYIKLYNNEQSVKSIIDNASIGSTNKFKQIGKVKEN